MPSTVELLEELNAARERLARAEVAECNAAADERNADREWERCRLDGDEGAAEHWREKRAQAVRRREDEARAKALLAERVASLTERHREAEEREGEVTERHERDVRTLNRQARAFASALRTFLAEHPASGLVAQSQRAVASQREMALRAGQRHYASHEIRIYQEALGPHPGLAETLQALVRYEELNRAGRTEGTAELASRRPRHSKAIGGGRGDRGSTPPTGETETRPSPSSSRTCGCKNRRATKNDCCAMAFLALCAYCV